MGEVLFAWNWNNNFLVELLKFVKDLMSIYLHLGMDEEGIIINLGLNLVL